MYLEVYLYLPLSLSLSLSLALYIYIYVKAGQTSPHMEYAYYIIYTI